MQYKKLTVQRNLWRTLELKQFKFKLKDQVDLHNLFPKSRDRVNQSVLRNGILHTQLEQPFSFIKFWVK